MTRGGRSTGFCQEAWLLVAQGGWWKPRDILEQLPSGVEVDDASCQLWIMANRHKYLQRRGILVIVNSAEEHAALIDSEIRIMTRLVVGGVIVLAVWVAVILWILA
jgi:hypothetical protein